MIVLAHFASIQYRSLYIKKENSKIYKTLSNPLTVQT